MPHRIVERISKEEVNSLPILSFDGPIHLIRTDDDLPPALEELASHSVLGFDTESRPVFHSNQRSNGPALLQLATETQAWLFQLKRLNHLEALFEILANPRILKVGVAPHDDIKGLQGIHPFEEASFIDLSKIATSLGIVTTGLRNLTAMFLKRRLSKGAQVSNWELENLSNGQKLYAATDAWISLRLYQELIHVKALQDAQAPAINDGLIEDEDLNSPPLSDAEENSPTCA
ncbi:MAG: 3'-5' exonuclease [Puniceicoccaceae bacterium]